MKIIILLLSALFFYGCSQLHSANQIHDPDFIPVIEHPKYPEGAGPKVFIDEGHNNYHTMSGRYKPFADLLRKDGFRVFPYKEQFTRTALEQVDILVIVNPVHESNIKSWSLPTPSAFTDTEIEIVNNWVKSGGKLWLIADHMPIPGAAEKLALSFGFLLQNGFAYGPDKKSRIRFGRENGTLVNHAITNGSDGHEFVESVYTYTGHAFQIPSQAEAILVFEVDSYSLNPKQAFKFDKETTRVDISNWSQGAIRQYGEGRIAVFGEAGAFTAQISGKKRIKWGMNSADASNNARFALNLMHWLADNMN